MQSPSNAIEICSHQNLDVSLRLPSLNPAKRSVNPSALLIFFNGLPRGLPSGLNKLRLLLLRNGLAAWLYTPRLPPSPVGRMTGRSRASGRDLPGVLKTSVGSCVAPNEDVALLPNEVAVP